jgi:hypothetical protein
MLLFIDKLKDEKPLIIEVDRFDGEKFKLLYSQSQDQFF